MNLQLIDWVIVGALLVFLISVALASRRHTQSVADFLAAGRCAGRYLISVSEGAAGLGAITLVAFWEMYYQRGFTAIWWNLPNWPILFIIAMTGWVAYRFRQTRALTLAQFFEMRYSRRFRIFAGLIAFICGVINFGIFPAVGTRFFIYFCGLPPEFVAAGIEFNTFATLMAGLLVLALFFTFVGGQIAIILTDFIQGLVTLTILVITVGILLYKVEWSSVVSALLQAPPRESYLNPFDIQDTKGFNVRFFMIMYFMWFYQWMAWQGTQGFNASAKSPHEQRMAKVLGTWRYFAQEMLIPIIAICALAFMLQPELFPTAAGVQGVVDNMVPEHRTQMTVPVALSHLLPAGLMGGLCAMMLAAFISNHDSYLHSWGSILVQDVIMPLRGRPLSPSMHLWLLRLSILGVAIFIFFFSLLFQSSQYILMFFRITGGIYLGGAGAVIVGGLYWKHGRTAGAWTAMIVGAIASLIGLALLEIKPENISWLQGVFSASLFVGPLGWFGGLCAWVQDVITGQDMLLIVSLLAIASYVVVSLLQPGEAFNLDRMLRRGAYADAGSPSDVPATGLNLLRVGSEFTAFDKGIYLASFGWMFLCGVVFAGGLIYHHLWGTTVENWIDFWYYLVVLAMTMGTAVVVWFAIGGIRDVVEMFARLRVAVRDDTDDGSVRDDDREPVQQPELPEPETAVAEQPLIERGGTS